MNLILHDRYHTSLNSQWMYYVFYLYRSTVCEMRSVLPHIQVGQASSFYSAIKICKYVTKHESKAKWTFGASCLYHLLAFQNE